MDNYLPDYYENNDINWFGYYKVEEWEGSMKSLDEVNSRISEDINDNNFKFEIGYNGSTGSLGRRKSHSFDRKSKSHDKIKQQILPVKKIRHSIHDDYDLEVINETKDSMLMLESTSKKNLENYENHENNNSKTGNTSAFLRYSTDVLGPAEVLEVNGFSYRKPANLISTQASPNPALMIITDINTENIEKDLKLAEVSDRCSSIRKSEDKSRISREGSSYKKKYSKKLVEESQQYQRSVTGETSQNNTNGNFEAADNEMVDINIYQPSDSYSTFKQRKEKDQSHIDRSTKNIKEDFPKEVIDITTDENQCQKTQYPSKGFTQNIKEDCPQEICHTTENNTDQSSAGKDQVDIREISPSPEKISNCDQMPVDSNKKPKKKSLKDDIAVNPPSPQKTPEIYQEEFDTHMLTPYDNYQYYNSFDCGSNQTFPDNSEMVMTYDNFGKVQKTPRVYSHRPVDNESIELDGGDHPSSDRDKANYNIAPNFGKTKLKDIENCNSGGRSDGKKSRGLNKKNMSNDELNKNIPLDSSDDNEKNETMDGGKLAQEEFDEYMKSYMNHVEEDLNLNEATPGPMHFQSKDTHASYDTDFLKRNGTLSATATNDKGVDEDHNDKFLGEHPAYPTLQVLEQKANEVLSLKKKLLQEYNEDDQNTEYQTNIKFYLTELNKEGADIDKKMIQLINMIKGDYDNEFAVNPNNKNFEALENLEANVTPSPNNKNLSKSKKKSFKEKAFGLVSELSDKNYLGDNNYHKSFNNTLKEAKSSYYNFNKKDIIRLQESNTTNYQPGTGSNQQQKHPKTLLYKKQQQPTKFFPKTTSKRAVSTKILSRVTSNKKVSKNKRQSLQNQQDYINENYGVMNVDLDQQQQNQAIAHYYNNAIVNGNEDYQQDIYGEEDYVENYKHIEVDQNPNDQYQNENDKYMYVSDSNVDRNVNAMEPRQSKTREKAACLSDFPGQDNSPNVLSIEKSEMTTKYAQSEYMNMYESGNNNWASENVQDNFGPKRANTSKRSKVNLNSKILKEKVFGRKGHSFGQSDIIPHRTEDIKIDISNSYLLPKKLKDRNQDEIKHEKIKFRDDEERDQYFKEVYERNKQLSNLK